METIYYENKGRAFTTQTLESAKKRALELGIKNVVIPTSHGFTPVEAARIFSDTDIHLTAVSLSSSFDPLGWSLSPDQRRAVEKTGVTLLSSSFPALANMDDKDNSDAERIANTLRWFSQGTKVAVEIAIMVAEAGIIEPGKEIISMGGNDGGVDTALVLCPACLRQLSDIKILELLCKPRVG